MEEIELPVSTVDIIISEWMDICWSMRTWTLSFMHVTIHNQCMYSTTVYEDATPKILRDFFLDDEFRAEWEDMLIHVETLEKNQSTGTMVVQWVRKIWVLRENGSRERLPK